MRRPSLFHHFSLFFWPGHAACGILVPWPGSNPHSLQWKRRVLTTGPPGKPLSPILQWEMAVRLIPSGQETGRNFSGKSDQAKEDLWVLSEVSQWIGLTRSLYSEVASWPAPPPLCTWGFQLAVLCPTLKYVCNQDIPRMMAKWGPKTILYSRLKEQPAHTDWIKSKALGEISSRGWNWWNTHYIWTHWEIYTTLVGVGSLGLN